MSDVPSDEATEAAARALCAYRSVEWGDLSPDDREGVLCEGEAALVAGMRVERAGLADRIEQDNPREGEYAPDWHAALRWASDIVRAAAGGTP